MAVDSEYRLDLFDRAGRALANKAISKTVHVKIVDPRPGVDPGICLVHNNADPVGPRGQRGKDKGFGLPGGILAIDFEIWDPVGGIWIAVNEKNEPFNDAWLAVQGYTALTLSDGETIEALDITVNSLNKAIRRYEYGAELTLKIADEQGKEKTLKIKPVREETLAEAAKREVLGETGLSIEIVPMPDKRDFVFAEEKPSRENNGAYYYKYTVLGIVTQTSTVPPTEITETDEWIWASLRQPLHHVFNQCRNKDSFIYFSHNVNIIKSFDRLYALLRYADGNEQAFYNRIPRTEMHESWRYCFEVCGYRISGGPNRTYPIYADDGTVLPPDPPRGRKVRAWHLIMDALKKSDLDKATPEFIQQMFAPLQGGVSAYLGEIERSAIIQNLPSLEQEKNAKLDETSTAPLATKPPEVSQSPESNGGDASDDETDEKLQELFDAWEVTAAAKPLPMTDEEYAKSLGY